MNVDLDMSERVTIGLCVKDSERTIHQSIESILSQKYPMELIQLVVVDGCSKDKTLSIINNETSKSHILVETFSDQGQGTGPRDKSLSIMRKGST